jgi:selenocysteine lyase/cysteine desulfurase
MNTIAQGLSLQQGDHILTTDHEHPGGRVCWDYYARKSGIIIDAVSLPLPPKSKQEIVQAFERNMTDRTRVISVSHVLFTTGLKLPITELADLAHAHNALLVVDGAQAPGGNLVDVKTLKCDAYATSAHKWLLAPKGTGLLYISANARKQIDPILLQAGMGTYTAATGTRNLPGIIGLGAAIELLNAAGKEAVAGHAMKLRNALYQQAQTLPRVTIASPEPGELAAPILTLAFPKEVSNETIVQRLREQYNIVVKCVPSNYVNGIRVSMHLYTQEEDLARLTAALRKELG